MMGQFFSLKMGKRKNPLQVEDLNALAWSEVRPTDNVVIGDDLGGFYCLEELDEDVDCVWEETEAGKTLKIMVCTVRRDDAM
jgi:hypothetical protein